MRRFPAGVDLIRLGGCFYHHSERRSVDLMSSTTTPLSENVVLAEPSCGSKDLSDYINHSCRPNIGFRDALSFVAVRETCL